MARISLWKNEKYGLDAKFFDRTISEQFTVGGVDAYIHKYLGTNNPNVTNDATQPNYPNLSANNIQDLLFLENRDRKYAQDIYRLRCHYNTQDLDLDLSQFGLMIASGTLYITFHMVDMVNAIGRKLMSGDVLELPNLKDFYSLDETIPVALKRFYVVQEGTRPQAGYSPTWWSHLWRVKCTPMVDSQEYADILNQTVIGVNGQPIMVNGNTTTYGNITSSGNMYQSINDAIITQATVEVPKSGYNTNALWAPLFVDGNPKKGTLPVGSSPQQKFTGYLVNDGTAVDGYNVSTATEFPSNPSVGQYILRQDYFPARLYRWSGSTWQYVNTEQRTPLTPGTGQTQRDTFVNNTGTFIDSSGNTEPILQTLSSLLRPDMGYPAPPTPGETIMVTEYTVPYSPTPIFNLQLGTTQLITLEGNAVASMIYPVATSYTFLIYQDSVGGHSFTWPSNFIGAGTISPAWNTSNPNSVASQQFVYVPNLQQFIAISNMTYTGQ